MGNKYPLFAADDVRDVWTIAVGGTPGAGDEVTVAIGVEVTWFFETTLTTAFGATQLKEAINAASKTENLSADEGYRNRGGQEVGQFASIGADTDGSLLRLVSNSSGHGFVPTVSVVGGVTLGTPTHVETATGKVFLDKDTNWDSATLPVAGENIIVRNSSHSLTDGFTVFAAILGLSLDLQDTMSGNLGRNRVNTDISGKSYQESKPTHVPFYPATSSGQVIHLGDEGGTAAISRFTNLDFGNSAIGTSLKLFVNNMPTRNVGGDAPVDIMGSHNIDMDVIKGSVDLGSRMDETVVTNIKDLIVRAGGDVYIGTNCTIKSSSTPFIVYGKLVLGVSHGSMDVTVKAGGELTLQEDFGDSDLILVELGGKIITNGVTIARLALDHGSTIDATDDVGSAIENLILNGEVNWIDPKGRLTVNSTGTGSAIGTGVWSPPPVS